MSSTKSDLEKVLEIISSGDVESLKSESFDQFQYLGFDPHKLIGALAKIKESKSVSDTQFQQNVYAMVAIGMIKGNVNDHNIKKMSEKGQEDIKKIMAKYGIKMGGGKNQASDVITFPRVMASFPDIAIRMVKVIGPKEFRGGPMMSTRLPGYLQVQVFPAVIPKSTDITAKSMLLTASLCYSIDQTIQISQMKNANLKEVAATQTNFIQVSHDSPVAASATRVKVFNALSLVADYATKIAPVLETYRELVDPDFKVISVDDFESSLG